MVDPEDAVFGESGGDRVVDLAARGKIGAERLFEPDPHIVAGKAALDQALDGRLEQARRGREEDRHALLGLADRFRKIVKPFALARIERLVAQPAQKRSDTAAALGGEELLERLAREDTVRGGVERRARGAHALDYRNEQLVSVERAERRQQHALGKGVSGPEQLQAVGGEAHVAGAFTARPGQVFCCTATSLTASLSLGQQ